MGSNAFTLSRNTLTRSGPVDSITMANDLLLLEMMDLSLSTE